MKHFYILYMSWCILQIEQAEAIQELSQSELLLAVRSTDSHTEENGSSGDYTVDDILEGLENDECADTAVSVSLL